MAAPGHSRYTCTCLTGLAHEHELPAGASISRGVHLPDQFVPSPSSAPPPPPPPEANTALDIADAVRGALWGMFIGDALGAPLHWMYTWPAAQEIKRAHFGGGLKGYAAPPPCAHPDSWRYFSRCTPAAEPVPALFEGDLGGGARGGTWAVPGTHYHAGLAAGDSTLSGRLVALVTHSLVADGGWDTVAYFRRYARLMLGERGGWEAVSAAGESGGGLAPKGGEGLQSGAAPAPAAPPADLLCGNADTWVDESHRVLLRNLALSRAGAWAGGLEDCCLTGLALAAPLLLAYSGDRRAGEVAARCLLQLSHKSEDMVRQAMLFGDALAGALAAAAARAAARAAAQAQAQASAQGGAPAPPHHAPHLGALLESLAGAFSGGKVDLAEVLARFSAGGESSTAGGEAPAEAREPADPAARDAPAFHGPRAVFSVR